MDQVNRGRMKTAEGGRVQGLGKYLNRQAVDEGGGQQPAQHRQRQTGEQHHAGPEAFQQAVHAQETE